MGLIPRILLNVQRFSGGDRTNGKWVNGTTTPLEIKASVQPLSAKEMQSLPEGRRATGQAYRLYTSDWLRTVEDNHIPPHLNPDEQPDQITIFGSQYEIFSGEVWGNSIINHNKYVATRLTSK